MRIVTLVENTACRLSMTAEHGLSLYIETGEHKILFDAGQSGAFADNAEKLGVDLRKVDFAVLSHGHYDHGGGLQRFLQINDTAPVYLNRYAFEPHYSAGEKYIGLNPELRKSDRLIFAQEGAQIAPGITLHSQIGCPFEIQPFGLSVRENGLLRDEDFRHEQYLLIEEHGKRICFSGCSHKGILNIVRWFHPDVLVGGFHFLKLDPEGDGAEPLRQAARQLAAYPAAYYTGHCTGEKQFAFLKELMGEQLQALSAGSSLAV